MKPQVNREQIDFEKLGYRTTLETGDPLVAKQICGLHIHSLEDEIQPEVSHLESRAAHGRARAAALHSWLYDRHEPVRDAAMLARRVAVSALIVLVAVVCATSVISHTLTFHLFGFPAILCLILGLTLTGIAAATGYQLFEKILVHHKGLEVGFICAAFLLCSWGLLELAQARAIMVNKAPEASAASGSSSYVDDAPAPSSSNEPQQQNESDEQRVRAMLGSAILKIMLAADAMLGILLGIVMLMRQDEDFVAWEKLRKISKQVAELERRRNELLSFIEIAKKRCMAGILRATHIPRKRHVPYHQLPVILLMVLMALPAFTQTVKCHEGFLLDVSGSIGKGGSNSDLFREYLVSIKRLLATEPPSCRVWVSVISTDSFGSVRELLRGWTPEGQGVFTDDLNRARHQLTSNFQSRAAGLAPVASGTDIIGGLWHMKALLESGAGSQHIQKVIWIFSDMMNETAQFNMPALIPTGPEGMLNRAKSNRLIAPLRGYRIHVLGASPAGMNPHEWNTIKTFWTRYFHEAGAELITYSAEGRCERD